MSRPRHLGPPDPGSGRGPFGEKAFRGALVGCAVLVVVGLPLVLATAGTSRAIGTMLLALGALGLVVGGGGLLAERLLQRRPPPPADVRKGNGHARPTGPTPSARRTTATGRRPRTRRRL